MTPGGWIVMTVSVTTVTVLMVWCIYKVLKIPKETEHLRSIDLHTPDQDED